jgi:phenylalanine ammonia-lyase
MLVGVKALHNRLADGEIIYGMSQALFTTLLFILVMISWLHTGVNTLFGGSADIQTDQTIELQQTLVRELQCGILPAHENEPHPARLDISLESLHLSYIPHSWARAAMLVRLNSLVKGFSSVRPVIAERLKDLLLCDITPVIPLRGSISASGDLSPLSYIAGALQGKRTIRIFSKKDPRLTADRALAQAKLEPISLQPKEGLAIVNGTAVSCAVAALTLYDVHGLAVLAQVITAMHVEALRGTVESFDPVFSDARPHPGQVREPLSLA